MERDHHECTPAPAERGPAMRYPLRDLAALDLLTVEQAVVNARLEARGLRAVVAGVERAHDNGSARELWLLELEGTSTRAAGAPLEAALVALELDTRTAPARPGLELG